MIIRSEHVYLVASIVYSGAVQEFYSLCRLWEPVTLMWNVEGHTEDRGHGVRSVLGSRD